ncbi:hypothetical protein INR49_029177 [Caranx melampygus]|nr:hypothetical protein INR49_029177 [Caranx melampygus]
MDLRGKLRERIIYAYTRKLQRVRVQSPSMLPRERARPLAAVTKAGGASSPRDADGHHRHHPRHQQLHRRRAVGPARTAGIEPAYLAGRSTVVESHIRPSCLN